MSEVGYGAAPPSDPRGASGLAAEVAQDVNAMGACAWVYWQAVEDLDGGAWKGLARVRPGAGAVAGWGAGGMALGAGRVGRGRGRTGGRGGRAGRVGRRKGGQGWPRPLSAHPPTTQPTSFCPSQLLPLSSLPFRALFYLSQVHTHARQLLAARRVARRKGAEAAAEYRRPWWGLLLVRGNGWGYGGVGARWGGRRVALSRPPTLRARPSYASPPSACPPSARPPSARPPSARPPSARPIYPVRPPPICLAPARPPPSHRHPRICPTHHPRPPPL